MATLGVAMIVKNAEDTLPGALSSVLHYASQIVVVDTGSLDHTPSIASRFGAELHFFNWIGDFASARNYSLSFLRTDWVLVLDSDEEFQFNTNPELSNQISLLDFHDYSDTSAVKAPWLLDEYLDKQENHIGGISIILENYLNSPNGNDQDNAVKSRHRFTRLFRNNKQFRFDGKVHEQIAPVIHDSGYDIVESNIKILHHGYINANIDKITRNRDLLIEELKRHPDDPYLKYHLAETEFSASNNDLAYHLFESLADSYNLSVEQLEIVRIRLSQISLSREDFENVDKWTSFKSKNVDTEGLRLYILGTSLLLRKDINAAKQCFKSQYVKNSSLVDKATLGNALLVIESIENSTHRLF